MKDKTDSDGKTAGRTFLVVDADGEGAEALRAELASRGFAVSVRRAETPDEAASGAALKVVLVVTAGSDEPFAVQSVRVDP